MHYLKQSSVGDQTPQAEGSELSWGYSLNTTQKFKSALLPYCRQLTPSSRYVTHLLFVPLYTYYSCCAGHCSYMYIRAAHYHDIHGRVQNLLWESEALLYGPVLA